MQMQIQWTGEGTPTATLAASGVLTGSARERLSPWDPSGAGWEIKKTVWFAGQQEGRLSGEWRPESGQRQTGSIAGKADNQRQKQAGHSFRETRAGPRQRQAGSSSGAHAVNAGKSCMRNEKEQSDRVGLSVANFLKRKVAKRCHSLTCIVCTWAQWTL